MGHDFGTSRDLRSGYNGRLCHLGHAWSFLPVLKNAHPDVNGISNIIGYFCVTAFIADGFYHFKDDAHVIYNFNQPLAEQSPEVLEFISKNI